MMSLQLQQVNRQIIGARSANEGNWNFERVDTIDAAELMLITEIVQGTDLFVRICCNFHFD